MGKAGNVSQRASIKFGPIGSLERMTDPNWRPDRQMYERGSLKFRPSQTSVPLLADHDPGREIGTVHELFPMEWPNGWWYMARATLAPNAPSWVAPGQPCSLGMRVLRRRSYPSFGIDKKVVASALVDEISILSPGTEAAEPGAHVLCVREEQPAPARTPGRPAAAGEEIIWGGGKYAGASSRGAATSTLRATS